VNRALKRAGKVLADRYHLRVSKSPRQTRNLLKYVLLNPRHHADEENARREERGLAARPLSSDAILDAASSARWFHGWLGDHALDRSPPRGLGSSPAVAKAQTWMLAVGWRLLGLIDPNDVPGVRTP
jgi:hypothetical protein